MPFPVPCSACATVFSVEEELFKRRIAGKVARFSCPNCGGLSVVDTTTRPIARLDAKAPVPARTLTEDAFFPEASEVAELSDDEVASLPPESLAALAAVKAQRPRPRPRLESKIDDELWVVSVKEGDEDQEIFESSLIEQIANGKVPPEAIVWREGIENWLPLADVPELAKYLPPPADDKTGGFLGTGMNVSFGSNAGERKSAPPPLPPKKRSYGSAKKKSYGGGGDTRTKPVALSPGFLFSVDDESEPPPELPQKGGKAVPKPPLRAPRRAITGDLDFSDIADEEIVPPSSGTPALRDLTTVAKKEPAAAAPAGSGGLFASLGGGDDEVLGPPSIDISDLGGAGVAAATAPLLALDSSGAPDAGPSEAPPSSKRAKKRKGQSKAPPSAELAAVSKVGTARSQAPKSRAPGTAAQSKPSLAPAPARPGWFTPGRVLVLLAIAGLAYFLISRQMQPPKTTTDLAPPEVAPPAAATAEAPQPEPTQAEAPAPTPPPEAEPSERAEAAPAEPAPAQPAPPPAAPAAPGEERASATPTPEPAAAPAAAPPAAEVKPKPAPAAPANPDAPPFNKDAAVAALNTAVAQASGCRQDGDPTGTARVVVTFAPSGRVTSANLNGPPFAGTRTGGCIAATMRRAKIPAFSGEYVTVGKSVIIR